MATYFRQFWIFKSIPNFSIFALMTSGTGYFAVRYFTDKKFEHPIFHESLRILEQNQQIIDLISVPMYIDTGLKSRATITDKIVNSAFIVKGPRGYLQVQLAGESKPQGALENSLAKVTTTDLTEEARKVRFEELKEFYIPDDELLTQVESARARDEKELENTLIPKDAKFWKINYLYVNVSDDFRVVLVPKKEQKAIEGAKEQSTTSTTVATVDKFKPNYQRKTLKDVLVEERQRIASKRGFDQTARTEEEIEELRRFRMQETYKKIGYVRFYMFFLLAGGGMVGYILFQKYRRKSVMGSVLHNQALMFIRRNDIVTHELGRNLRFPQQIRGAAIDDDADFELDAIGEKKAGTFRILGKFDKTKNDWELKTIEMILKGKKGEEVGRKKLY